MAQIYSVMRPSIGNMVRKSFHFVLNKVPMLAYAVRARAPLSTVKALVRTGVDPLTADINGVTPVLWAAANGDEDTIAYLREHGAGPDEKQKAAVKRLLRKAKEGIHFQ